jgi:hypothetical protein
MQANFFQKFKYKSITKIRETQIPPSNFNAWSAIYLPVRQTTRLIDTHRIVWCPSFPVIASEYWLQAL